MVSPLGLGTVKFGRNEQVKYPRPFQIPSDHEVRALLHSAAEHGVNLLDTAPAYGSSQARLGKLLPKPRDQWVIVSKVGEFFENGQSRFDFTYQTTIAVIEQSLRTLERDYLDVVLIHSDGEDLRIFEQEGVCEALHRLKERGLIRAHGMSSKTVAGGLRAVSEMDVVMATCNLDYHDELPVLQAAAAANKGVLIKKGLQSGHVDGIVGVEQAFRFIYSNPGVSSAIVGTINQAHLLANIQLLNKILEQG